MQAIQKNMCGIIYRKSFNGKAVNRDIRRQYFAQRDRGMKGYGFIAIDNGKVSLCKELYEYEIMRDLKLTPASEVIFHHRFPTSTKNTVQTAHPIATRSKKYAHNYFIIHNGIIGNDEELNRGHTAMGLKYATRVNDKEFNDSEALLHELALCIDGKKPLDKFDACGSIAFVLLQADKQDKPIALYFGRNWGSPLKMQYNIAQGLSLSSEGNGTEVPVDTLYKFDYSTKLLEYKPFAIPYPIYDKYQSLSDQDWASKYGYNTYHKKISDSETDIDDDDLAIDCLDELDDEGLQDIYYARCQEREILLQDLDHALKYSDYDEEQDIRDDLSEVDDDLNRIDVEMNRREMTRAIEADDSEDKTIAR